MRSLTSSRLSKPRRVRTSCVRCDEASSLSGKGVDFYNHLNIEPSATTSELNKAYRKKSLELQYVSSAIPDIASPS
jgi:hypothetical protein